MPPTLAEDDDLDPKGPGLFEVALFRPGCRAKIAYYRARHISVR
jgi:hypothetical protein